MNAMVVGQISLDAYVVEPPGLRDRLGLVRKRISTREILDHVESVVRAHGQQQRRVEGVHPTRRDVDSVNQLPLILSERLLIECVSDLKEVPREIKVQVQ